MSARSPTDRRARGPRSSRRASAARPQDMLEAAVVLEAWARRAGAAARSRTGARADARAHGAGPTRAPARLPRRAPPREGVAAEALAFVLTVSRSRCWAAPLAADLGAPSWSRRCCVALPLTLGAAVGRCAAATSAGRRDSSQLGAPAPASSLLGAACSWRGLPLARSALAGLLAGAADAHLDRRARCSSGAAGRRCTPASSSARHGRDARRRPGAGRRSAPSPRSTILAVGAGAARAGAVARILPAAGPRALRRRRIGAGLGVLLVATRASAGRRGRCPRSPCCPRPSRASGAATTCGSSSR